MRMANPPHPGEIIADVLDYLNIGIREFARALDVAPSTAQRLISGQSAVSPEMAVKLAAVIGSTSDMWLRLQSTYSLEKAEREVDVSHLTQLYLPEPLSARAC